MKAADRVRWGIGEMLWPAAAAILLSGIAFGTNNVPESAGNAPYWAFCAWYLAMAISGGAVLGLSRPFATGALGTGFVGFLTALPIVGLILFANPADSLPGTATDVLIALGIAAVCGPLTAAYVTIRRGQGKNLPPGV